MSARTITTSQPDLACDVCSRRLLRGEQPDVFRADGDRRLVCELCAPRAAHAGWLRESERQSLELPAPRPRRGRSMFARLRQSARTPAAADSPPADGELPEQRPRPPDPAEQAPGALHAGTATAGGESRSHELDAVELFNASAFPRRVAGLIRSLGVPQVSVRSAEHLASVVRIVIFWELCWYRYEVDLSEPEAQAQVIAQGRELAELAREERRANAHVSAAGELELDRARRATAPVAGQA